MENTHPIQWLMGWYQAQCDGDWEHTNGITIDSLDNPGWEINIDLEGTPLEGVQVPYQLTETSNDDWYGFMIDGKSYKGVGDPFKLEHLIVVFKELVEGHRNSK